MCDARLTHSVSTASDRQTSGWVGSVPPVYCGTIHASRSGEQRDLHPVGETGGRQDPGDVGLHGRDAHVEVRQAVYGPASAACRDAAKAPGSPMTDDDQAELAHRREEEHRALAGMPFERARLLWVGPQSAQPTAWTSGSGLIGAATGRGCCWCWIGCAAA
jgi:hypothetical protein